jgi:hypothetical protein
VTGTASARRPSDHVSTESLQPSTPESMTLFEVYEASGLLLYVSSVLDKDALQPGDRVYRRAWSTASQPEPVRTPAGTRRGS